MNLHIVMPSEINFIEPYREFIDMHSSATNVFCSLVASEYNWITYLSPDQVFKFVHDNDVSKILIHGLFEIHLNLLNHFAKSKIKIIWIFYGFEIDIFKHRALYSQSTINLIKGRYDVFFGIESQVKGFLRRVLKAAGKSKKFKQLAGIDVFGFWLYHEYETLFASEKIKPEYQFYYYPLSDIDKLFKPLETREKMHENRIPGRILLGNSSNPINNHVDVFYLLNQIGFAGEIVCPLSYGIDENYRKALVQKGNELFGARFQPLLKYLPLAEYTKIIDSCDVAFFNSYRHAAGFNIIYMLQAGKTVYLNEANPLYDYFLRLGCEVLSFNKLNDISKLRTISTHSAIINSNIVSGIFNHENSVSVNLKLLGE